MQHYGTAKVNMKAMRNKGVPQPLAVRKLADGQITETEFLRERRSALTKAVADAPDTIHDAGAAQNAWTKTHEAQLQKQRVLQTKRKVELFQYGTLLDDEVDDELELEVRKSAKRRSCCCCLC